MPDTTRRTNKVATRSSRRGAASGSEAHDPMPPAILRISETAEPLLTIDEVAERVGVCSKTIRRWIASGRLVAGKLGSRWRIHPAD